MVVTEKLSPTLNFGAVIRNITMDQIHDEPTRQQLRKLWDDRGLLVFRDTQVTPELHLALSRVFGSLEGHFQKDRYVEGHQELVWFSSDPVKESTLEVDGKLLIGWQPWHQDFRWAAHPNRGGLLREVKKPKVGGQTGFLCMIDAYNRLPESMKARLEGLEIVTQMLFDDHMQQFYRREKARTIKVGTTAENMRLRPKSDYVPVAHPLIRVQPETGRKMLYLAPQNVVGILGMDQAESDQLILELVDFITDPAYAYYHHWETTDLVLWDNLRMLHCATGVPPGETREVWRTTISSPYATGRNLAAGGWNWAENRPAATA